MGLGDGGRKDRDLEFVSCQSALSSHLHDRCLASKERQPTRRSEVRGIASTPRTDYIDCLSPKWSSRKDCPVPECVLVNSCSKKI